MQYKMFAIRTFLAYMYAFMGSAVILQGMKSANKIFSWEDGYVSCLSEKKQNSNRAKVVGVLSVHAKVNLQNIDL
jgi:hypothetical protein